MARVGVVPEEPDAPPEMTPLALSALCGRLHARWDAPAVAERFRRFEVPTDRAFARLSKGQKGAVMLALALGHAPSCCCSTTRRWASTWSRATRSSARSSATWPTGNDPLRDDPRPAGIEGIADHVAILHGGRLALAGRLEA